MENEKLRKQNDEHILALKNEEEQEANLKNTIRSPKKGLELKRKQSPEKDSGELSH